MLLGRPAADGAQWTPGKLGWRPVGRRAGTLGAAKARAAARLHGTLRRFNARMQEDQKNNKGDS